MANPTIEELEARLAEATTPPVDPVTHIDALNALSWVLRLTDADRANRLATEARELAIEHGHKLGQARAARTLGMTLRDPEALKTLFDLAEEARRLFDEVDDPAGRAGSRDFLASLYEYVGDLAGGLALALEARDIAREIGDPVRQGYALSSIGGILAASGQVDAAIEHLKEGLQFFEDIGDPEGIGQLCSRLSNALKDAGRYEEAKVYVRLSRNEARRSDGFVQWAALSTLGEIEEKQGHFEEAERLYHSALEQLDDEPSREVMGIDTEIAISRLLIRRGESKEAEQILANALSRIEDSPLSIVTKAEARELLSDAKEAQGDLRAAIDHLREAKTLRKSIAEREARNKIAQIEVRNTMEAARRDAEVHKSRFVELHGVQSKMLEAEKMALVGKLAAGAAHELNTPLGVLRSNANLAATITGRLAGLVGSAPDDRAQVEKLTSVLATCQTTSEEAVERIAAVARSFQRFSQLDQAELRTFNVKDGLQSALQLLEPTIPSEIEVVRKFDVTPAIEGWPREINHAFMTVLQNAVQAIQGAGVVTAEVTRAEDHVVVRVHDTGRGMSEAQTAHLFDVAWSEDGTRTKMRLGLSAAYTTTQKHGGTMGVDSVLGEGTTITFRFPIPAPRYEPSGPHAPA